MPLELPAYGTKIQVGNGASPEVFTTIDNLGDIDGPGVSVNVNDTTSHSTGSPYRGKTPGLIDAGAISFPVFYNPTLPTHSDTNTIGLGYLFKNRIKRNFRIVGTDPSATTRQFLGFVSEFSESYPVEGIQTRDTTIEIDGAITVV